MKPTDYLKALAIESSVQKSLNKYEGLISFSMDKGFDIDMVWSIYAPFVNERGIVQIGNDLYQFDTQNVKIKRNASVSDIPSLLAAKSSNQKQEIEVIPTRVTGASPSNGRIEDASYGTLVRNRFCQNSLSAHRILVYEDLYRKLGPLQGFNIVITLRGLQRVGLFFWGDFYNGELSGTCSYQFQGESPQFRVIPMIVDTKNEFSFDATNNGNLNCTNGTCLSATTYGQMRVPGAGIAQCTIMP
ncbi:hypothetical protein [Rhodoflexus caldus]|uniref:hypothetical protein n=1 Tax=Rhodoflexus caldus TaxID=2891236 RepID=UPI00202AA380|nr:hypothetical protein [Rhodoflexus caldus]